MIDHVGFEVSDLNRSGRFYDAVFGALGGRRMYESEQAVAYGITSPVVWIVVRGRRPGPQYGHMGLRPGVPSTARAATRATCAIRTASESRSYRADEAPGLGVVSRR
jgi:catechol 2,3-dioxygenase-like lactoylglutathione lyase family enzyme